MEITRQADYAVRAILELAGHGEGERIPSEEIASKQGIPPAFLTKILARLAAAGVVETQRGVKGGVRLAREPGKITLLDVVEAVDGPILLNRCARRPGECPFDSACTVHLVWMSIREDLRGRLAAVDFASLAGRR